MAARIPMTPMVISNSTNVNAREALIEYALRRMGMAYQRAFIFAKHFFRILPVGRACPGRSTSEAKIRWNDDGRSYDFNLLRLGQPRSE
jgi:hypothetical protein